jgi:tRNA (adenine37-N6)-methyltransferase
MKAKSRIRTAPRRFRSLPTLALGLVVSSAVAGPPEPTPSVYEVRPIGWVRKADGRTTIVLDAQYRPGLLGVDALEAIWVLYWFDRNDTPEQRATLQVHPHGDPANPLRGVFATRAPVRPNLIALSRCRVLSVQGSVIEIDEIDALPDTPVLDIKP